MYTAENHVADKARILEALDAILSVREAYKDVVAIPEVVTLHDITEYRLDTYKGAKQFKELFDKDTAASVLHYFNGNDYITPESFENTVVCALNARQTKK
jgi:hypothetical protein